MATLILVLKKIKREDRRKCDTFYSNSKGEIIISESDIDDVFESTYTAVVSNMQKSLGKGSVWIFDSVIEHSITANIQFMYQKI